MATSTTNLSDKILAVLEGATYKEADEALQAASAYLVKAVQDKIAKMPVPRKEPEPAPRTRWGY